MSLNISFNQNWNCCYHQTTIENDDIIVSSITNASDNLNWFPVELPHIINVKTESTIRNRIEKCWYRKQFQLILPDQQLVPTVSLTLKSLDNETNAINDSIIVWIDTVKIFSGSLSLPELSIELPQVLLNSNETKNSNQKHTLIVCCINTCLSFNTFLTLPYGTICSIKEMEFDTTVKNTINSSQRNHNNDNFTTCLNNITPGASIVPSSMDEKRKLSNATTNKTTVEASNHEKIQTNMYLDGPNHTLIPRLNIVMLIVGTRGDVQPFIAYGQTLRSVGHRVRLATHEKFRKFVRENGLEFYPLASDPAEIMSFMVENSGIFPSFGSVVSGKVFKRRHLFSDIMNSTWLACISDDDETGVPFQADAIIANPICYGHVHCAQKLGIPLHMAFTMPYSPTSAFPHPLSNVDYSKASRERLNRFSYRLVETMMWLGIGDLINNFRHNILDLPHLSLRQATSIMTKEKIPYTYCWSPSLVPKPSDWPFYIDVSGYFFLDLATNYTTPPEDLLKFLGLDFNSSNPRPEISPPIFIGFGSITGHDSKRLLKIIFGALQATGYRALLYGFDIDANQLPETIFKLDEVPFDWLFQHVSAVCHHGGAGTTAAGLHAGKPTITVPFFGDQFFWGDVVEKSGAGPHPLPGKKVTVEDLVEAFKFVHQPTVQNAAKRIQEAMSHENGCIAAMKAFHANLPLSRMRSDLESTYAACFRLNEYNLQVSRPVAQVLLSAGVVNESQFSYHITRNWRVASDDKSESNTNEHPSLDDFQLSTSDVRSTTYDDSKNDLTSSMNRPHTTCQRPRRASMAPTETLVAAVDNIMKPFSNTLLSTNGLDQNKYATTQTTFPKNIDVLDETTVNTLGHTDTLLSTVNDNRQQPYSDDISVLARNAAHISGFSPEVCEHILVEFSKYKRKRIDILTIGFTKRRQPRPATYQRSRSFSNLSLIGCLVQYLLLPVFFPEKL